jgi:hypothetical protein
VLIEDGRWERLRPFQPFRDLGDDRQLPVNLGAGGTGEFSPDEVGRRISCAFTFGSLQAEAVINVEVQLSQHESG